MDLTAEENEIERSLWIAPEWIRMLIFAKIPNITFNINMKNYLDITSNFSRKRILSYPSLWRR